MFNKKLLQMYSTPVAHIDLAALEHNFNQVRKLAPKSKIMAMIKANGYGHGLLQIANGLSAADGFGVACPTTGLSLRKSGITKRILVMRGFCNVRELKLLARNKLDAVIHTEYQLEILQQTTLDEPITVWLKIDTGMHRLGFLPEQVVKAYKQLQQNPNVKEKIQIMTHFANADNSSKNSTKEQAEMFEQITVKIPEFKKSVANSAVIINNPQYHADWVRPGIMLYGVSPMANITSADLKLQPVMTLHAQLIAVKNLVKNSSIGYGSTWQCPDDMPIGVANIGYGDGYPRHAKNGIPILVGGIACKLAGRVSMDLITVDLRNNPGAKCGDTVTLWGKDLPIERVAVCSDTIGYELLCGVTQRVKFIYTAKKLNAKSSQSLFTQHLNKHPDYQIPVLGSTRI